MRLFWTAGVAACLLATVQHADAFCQTPGACFPLAANNICGSSFVGYGINSLYFDEFPATGVNTDTFNQVMIQRYETISVVADNFISNKGCSASASSFISQNFRYQLSFWCSVIIRDNIMQSSCSCPPPAGSPVHGPALCTAQCQIATASVQSLLNDPTACPATSNTTQSQGRTTTLGTFQTYCSTTAPADLATPNGGPCYAGVDQDVQFCGFLDATDMANGCSSLPNDPCCASHITSSSSTTTATATATATASSTTTPISPTGAASPTASPTPASSGGSSINLPVILGSVGGALVLCAIVAVVLVRRRHNSSTSDGNYKVLNAAGHRPAPSGTQLMPMSGHASPANARSVGPTSPPVAYAGGLRSPNTSNSNNQGYAYPSQPGPAQHPPVPAAAPYTGFNASPAYVSREVADIPGQPIPLSPRSAPPANRPPALPNSAVIASPTTSQTIFIPSQLPPYSAAPPSEMSFSPSEKATPASSHYTAPSQVPTPAFPQQLTPSFSQQPSPAVGLYTSPAAYQPAVSSNLAGPSYTPQTLVAIPAAQAGPAGLQPSYVPPHINTTAPYTPPPASLPSSNRDSDSLFTPLTSVIAGQLVTAIHPYESQLGDELPLTQGQNIKVLRSFDDGWALGQIIETGRQGAFPIVCVCSTEQYPKIVQALQAASPSISGSDIAGHTPSLPDTNHVSSRVSSMILTPTDSLPGH